MATDTLNKIEDAERFDNRTVTVSSTVVEETVLHNKSNSTVIKVNKSGALDKGFKIQLWSYGDDVFSCGDKLSLKLELHSLKNSDYKNTLYSDNIFMSATLKEVEKREGSDLFYCTLQKIRDYITTENLKNLSYESSATILGITIGEKKFFSEEFRNNIKITGVSHVMVVSGMHLAIIMSAIYCLLRKISNNRFVKSFIGIVAVVFIVGVCGFSVSAIRAGIMFALASIAPILNRENDSLNSLGLAVILIYCTSPFAIFSLSFQLSVLATFGVIAIEPYFNELFCRKIENGFIKSIVEIIVLTLSATLTTMPVVIYYFESLSLISPVTNVLISTAVTVVLLFNVIAVIITALPLISAFSYPLYFVCEIICRYINCVINGLAEIKYASVSVPHGFAIIAVILNIMVIYIMQYCKKREYLVELSEAKEKR